MSAAAAVDRIIFSPAIVAFVRLLAIAAATRCCCCSYVLADATGCCCCCSYVLIKSSSHTGNSFVFYFTPGITKRKKKRRELSGISLRCAASCPHSASLHPHPSPTALRRGKEDEKEPKTLPGAAVHLTAPRRMVEEVENGIGSEAAASPAAGSPILDLPEPLLLHILGFLTDARSQHRAALACHRLLAAERATRMALWLRGVPRSLVFQFLPPGFCFPTLEHLDLSLVSLWSNPFLSAAYGASSSAQQLQHPDEVAEQNAFITTRLALCFPAVSSLAVYCRDPDSAAGEEAARGAAVAGDSAAGDLASGGGSAMVEELGSDLGWRATWRELDPGAREQGARRGGARFGGAGASEPSSPRLANEKARTENEEI